MVRTIADAECDKSWTKHQVAGFQRWLNFTLVGAEEHGHGVDDGACNVDADGNVDGNTKRQGGGSSSPLKDMIVVVRARLRLSLFSFLCLTFSKLVVLAVYQARVDGCGFTHRSAPGTDAGCVPL